jgi:hypothetical protein
MHPENTRTKATFNKDETEVLISARILLCGLVYIATNIQQMFGHPHSDFIKIVGTLIIRPKLKAQLLGASPSIAALLALC